MVWAHTTSFTPSLSIDVSVQNQESERSCICALWVSILIILFWNCSGSVIFLFFILMAFQSVDLKVTWWRLSQKHVVRTKLDIYVFISWYIFILLPPVAYSNITNIFIFPLLRSYQTQYRIYNNRFLNTAHIVD